MFGHEKLLSTGAQAEGQVTKASDMDPGFHKKLMVHVRVRLPHGSTHEFLDKVVIDHPALRERHAPVKEQREAELRAQLDDQFERLGTAHGAPDRGSADMSARVHEPTVPAKSLSYASAR